MTFSAFSALTCSACCCSTFLDDFIFCLRYRTLGGTFIGMYKVYIPIGTTFIHSLVVVDGGRAFWWADDDLWVTLSTFSGSAILHSRYITILSALLSFLATFSLSAFYSKLIIYDLSFSHLEETLGGHLFIWGCTEHSGRSRRWWVTCKFSFLLRLTILGYSGLNGVVGDFSVEGAILQALDLWVIRHSAISLHGRALPGPFSPGPSGCRHDSWVDFVDPSFVVPRPSLNILVSFRHL